MNEEYRTAKRLASLVNDVTLDLDNVGKHLAYHAQTVTLNRLEVILDAATEERDKAYDDYTNKYQS